MQRSDLILTDDIKSAIKALFPRYPTKQAVTLPALHIVNEQLGYVPTQAVVEIAESAGTFACPSAGYTVVLRFF